MLYEATQQQRAQRQLASYANEDFLWLLLSTDPTMTSSPPSCILEETAGTDSPAHVLSSVAQPSVLANLPHLSVDQLNQYLTSALAQLQQSASSSIASTFTAAGVMTGPPSAARPTSEWSLHDISLSLSYCHALSSMGSGYRVHDAPQAAAGGLWLFRPYQVANRPSICLGVPVIGTQAWPAGQSIGYKAGLCMHLVRQALHGGCMAPKLRHDMAGWLRHDRVHVGMASRLLVLMPLTASLPDRCTTGYQAGAGSQSIAPGTLGAVHPSNCPNSGSLPIGNERWD